jgi:iron complex outermembrane receptor protein/hemoglobin/transferrin/lactoferrin receptor protein
MRWDRTALEVPVDPLQPVVPRGFEETYQAITGSVGVVYRLTDRLTVAGNVGRGWRPPNAFELFARGIHGGVAAFQQGNTGLSEESVVGKELSVRYQSAHFRVSATGFRSDFDDYIYLVDTGRTWTNPANPAQQLPIFGYGQDNATLDGIEGILEAVPLEELELSVVYSSVNTTNEATGRRLPQTPPDRLAVSARTTTPMMGQLLSPFAELTVEWSASGVMSGPDEPYYPNAATDAYHLVHLMAGFQVLRFGGVLGVNLGVRNVLDETYTDFLYPYKAFGVPNPGRDVRLLTRFQF